MLGLFRLFWIPDGEPAPHGAYVRYPTYDLLGILALESARHQALVVGEDLGTVPPEVPPALAQWGVLSSKVLVFRARRARRIQTEPRLSRALARDRQYARHADDRRFLARARHRRPADVGMLSSDDEVGQARADRARDRAELVRLLASERILPTDAPPETTADLSGAVHEFLCRSPAELVGLSLDDLGGELDSVNVPGVGPDRHSSWTRKMRLTLEEIRASDDVRRTLRCTNRSRSETT